MVVFSFRLSASCIFGTKIFNRCTSTQSLWLLLVRTNLTIWVKNWIWWPMQCTSHPCKIYPAVSTVHTPGWRNLPARRFIYEVHHQNSCHTWENKDVLTHGHRFPAEESTPKCSEMTACPLDYQNLRRQSLATKGIEMDILVLQIKSSIFLDGKKSLFASVSTNTPDIPLTGTNTIDNCWSLNWIGKQARIWMLSN